MSAAPVVGTAWSRKPKRVVIAASVGSGVAYNFEGGTGTATLKHFLEEFAPATEKAAPIPADIQLIAGTLVIPVSKTLSQEQCNDLFGAIMKALVADRASQEERHTPECRANMGWREERMVTVERDEDGTPTVWCDPCIAPLVKALNDAGIRTVASCCGHSHRPGNIALADGRWLVIAQNDEEWRRIEAQFPIDINGEDRSQEQRIREDEREACAKIAEGWLQSSWQGEARAARYISDAIRLRGDAS